MKKKTFVIAGGGTGGHIYPGVAIARAAQKLDPNLEIHFVGTRLGLESKIVPREGFPLHYISVGKLNYGGGVKGLFGKLKTLLILPWSFLQSFVLLMSLRPQAVLGVGGYASGPLVLVASLLGFRSAIWEPNAYPGMTNRWLSRFVRNSFVVFADAQKFLKSKRITTIGLPVRESLENFAVHQARVASDGESSVSDSNDTRHSKNEFHLLVFGGSQGARALNNVMIEAVRLDRQWLRGVKIVHQTGTHDYKKVLEGYSAYKGDVDVEVQEFLYDMDSRYRWADLVICRSGASTVAELAACSKPSILVPLPTAADNHQLKNAESLKSLGGAEILEQKNLSARDLIDLISSLKNNPNQLHDMAVGAHRLYKPQAALEVARVLLDKH